MIYFAYGKYGHYANDDAKIVKEIMNENVKRMME